PRLSLMRSRGGKKKNRARRTLAAQLRASQNCSQESLLSNLERHLDDKKQDNPSSRIPRAVALLQQGYVSRATKSLFQKEISPVTQETISQMESLHPPA